MARFAFYVRLSCAAEPYCLMAAALPIEQGPLVVTVHRNPKQGQIAAPHVDRRLTCRGVCRAVPQELGEGPFLYARTSSKAGAVTLKTGGL